MEPDYSQWHFIPQAPSSYDIHKTCQIENLGKIFESLPAPFGIFKPNYHGTFVEVGAFNGPTYSNVWQFAKAGWKGIMIEPMCENLDNLRDNLSAFPAHRVNVEPVACSDKAGTLPMFFEREGSRAAKAGELTHQIKAMRLDDILHRNNWKPDFDLLVIDTEDHELQVLAGFDLYGWAPKLCIIETHGPLRMAIHAMFDTRYRTCSEDGLNTIFARRDWCPE